jgi:DNA polymerase
VTVAVALPRIGAVAAWRDEARRLMAQGVAPEQVLWRRAGEAEAGGDLFDDGPGVAHGPPAPPLTLSPAALGDLRAALHHADARRFARAYALVWRLAHGAVRWGDRTDPAMRRLLEQRQAVAREVHKTHAFVRFRETPAIGGRRAFAAWFEPDHPMLEMAAPFFADRFGDMDWAIATPDLTAVFRDGALSFVETEASPPLDADATEELWRVYYGSIFNPARVRTRAMQAEMPKRYWRNLPEAAAIPALVRAADARAAAMVDAPPTVPPPRAAAIARRIAPPQETPQMTETLDNVRAQAESCTRCPLYGPATQLVWGEGPPDAALMLVGEQPGDQEDLQGRPFVGPAGQLLRRAAAEAELDLASAYVTNAVKHFKFKPIGKRRLHQRPNAGEVSHCRWWLDLEVARVAPKLVVAMGATAALALTGRGEGVTKRRGQVEGGLQGAPVFLTVHPSFLLRLPNEDLRREEYARFVDDLGAANRSVMSMS